MKPLLLPAFLFIGLFANADATPVDPAPPATFDPTAIGDHISAWVRATGISGLSVVLVRDGTVALAQGYGKSSLASGEPVSTNTIFAIGSVTKQFTAACVLLLAEDGKLSVHDKVAKYFPGLTRAEDITLLDLMNHVSGYPDYYPLDFVDRRMKAPIEVDELIRRYATGKLDFEPGMRWSYSNTGYLILGRVVEKVSGESFGAFLDHRILKPLGMDRTVYDPPGRGQGFALGHSRFALGPLSSAGSEARGWLAAAGSLNSTALDLAKWDMALVEGRVLRPDSYALMTTPRQLSLGRVRGYGCGIAVSYRNGLLLLEHEGEVGGFQACNTVLPATKSAVVILSNCEEWNSVDELKATLVSLIMPESSDVPKINGPAAAMAAKDFFLRLQTLKIDRAQLGGEFSIFLDDEKLKGASARLKPYGKPVKVEVFSTGERGGMEVTKTRFTFKKGILNALMYRTPDGVIQEFLLRP